MKDMKKILFLDLPPALMQAVAEQLPPEHVAVTAGKTDEAFDLIVAADNVADADCPVLALDTRAPAKLGEILRRIGGMLQAPALYMNDITLDGGVFSPQNKTATTGSGSVALTDREAAIITCLAKHGGRSVPRDVLLKDVWQYQDGIDTHTLETHVYRLRQKLEPLGAAWIVTDEGGYSLGGRNKETA